MVETVLNKNKGKLLTENVRQHFANISRTKYWLEIVYYKPFDGYNCFFYIARPQMFTRSIPVGEFDHCNFDELIKILKIFRQTFQFTIDLHGFTKEQKRKLYEEKIL